MSFTASISVDLASLEVDIASESLETLIEEGAKVALREFQKTEFQFEGLAQV